MAYLIVHGALFAMARKKDECISSVASMGQGCRLVRAHCGPSDCCELHKKDLACSGRAEAGEELEKLRARDRD